MIDYPPQRCHQLNSNQFSFFLCFRYPFSDSEHSSLFAKISRGTFVIPEGLSSRARCLIRSLLRRDPSERLTAEDCALHPWFTRGLGGSSIGTGCAEERAESLLPRGQDQLVPNQSPPKSHLHSSHHHSQAGEQQVLIMFLNLPKSSRTRGLEFPPTGWTLRMTTFPKFILCANAPSSYIVSIIKIS